MPIRLNPIDHPICLAMPEWRAPSCWTEHIPFAMWLTSTLRPRVLVELGTFRGTSYCGFCQAITGLSVPARAYAVDNWKGDPHNGSTGPEVLAELRAYHDPRYGDFSTLLQMTFDEAVQGFADGEIDLLHIDGYHIYEAVAHDFQTWRSKVSDRGVVLFHDVVERMADFGVYRLWEELAAEYPSFTFEHEHGLGVLAVGRDLPDELRTLVGLRGDEAQRVRSLFHELGRRVSLQAELEWARDDRESSSRFLENVNGAQHELLIRLRNQFELERSFLVKSRDQHARTALTAQEQLARSEQERAQLDARVRVYAHERDELQQSSLWQLLLRLNALAGRLAKESSQTRSVLREAGRVVRLVSRQGATRVARRKLAGALETVATRVRAVSLSGHPWQPDGRPLLLLVSHDCGGGVKRHVGELDTELRQASVRPVHVRPARAGLLVWEEFNENGELVWCRHSTSERDSMARQLMELKPAHAHVHHTSGVPGALLQLLVDQSVPYDWTIHDYHTICPRVHLISAEHSYCGEPDAVSCNQCVARLGDDQGRPVAESITAWREHFAQILGRARRVFAPSDDVRRRLLRYFPELHVLVRPHFESLPALPAPPLPGAEVRVAVIGTIVESKGSLRLEECARDARRRRLPLSFHVIGSTDRDRALERLGNVRVTGRYRDVKVYDHLAASQCHIAFLPSVCPETFMYSLSIAMAARLFVVCFDLGAQTERVRAWGWGQALALESSAEAVNDAIASAAGSLAGRGPAPPPPASAAYPDLLTSYYDFSAPELARMFRAHSPHDNALAGRPHSSHRSQDARIH